MNSDRLDVEKSEKNIKLSAAISNILEPETIKNVHMTKFVPAMAPDTFEWNRKVKCLKYWRTEILGSQNPNLTEKISVDKSIKQAVFNHRKCYRRDKRIQLMGMFQDKCISMNSFWDDIRKYTDSQNSYYNASELTADTLAKCIYDLQHKGNNYVPISKSKIDKIFEETTRLPGEKFKLKVPPWTGNSTSDSIKKCVQKAKKNTRGKDSINGRFLDLMPICYQPVLENLFRTSLSTGTFLRLSVQTK